MKRVSSFEASKFKITNEQYLEFVLDGGYHSREYWSEEGWEWVQFKQANHPLFWVCPMNCKSGCGSVLAQYSHCQERHFGKKELDHFTEYCSLSRKYKNNELASLTSSRETSSASSSSSSDDDSREKRLGLLDNSKVVTFKFRLMFDVVDMPRNWPVEVNYHEAKAYCAWKGKAYRLLTEAEHHAIRDQDVLDLNPSSDIIYQAKFKANHNMTYGSSTVLIKLKFL
jgi:formylglycine-generating enzyme required for sulfatase activity